MIWLLIAFPIGILSALRPRSLIDRGGMVFVLIGISRPPAVAELHVRVRLRLPAGAGSRSRGYCDMFPPAGSCGGPVQWAYHLILPWFTFALAFAAIYARMIRASLSETLDEDYVRTARAKGPRRVAGPAPHALRNAMLPIVTMIGMDLGLAFGRSPSSSSAPSACPGRRLAARSGALRPAATPRRVSASRAGPRRSSSCC